MKKLNKPKAIIYPKKLSFPNQGQKSKKKKDNKAINETLDILNLEIEEKCEEDKKEIINKEKYNNEAKNKKENNYINNPLKIEKEEQLVSNEEQFSISSESSVELLKQISEIKIEDSCIKSDKIKSENIIKNVKEEDKNLNKKKKMQKLY